MIPRLTIRQRLVAWLLFRFERFDSPEAEKFNIIKHPELLRCVGLLRDRHYSRGGRK